MYEKFAVNNLVDAISDILVPKLTQFIEDKKNSEEIQAKIKERIKSLEKLEEMVDNMTSSYDFSELRYSSITVDGYNFNYNKDLDVFEMGESIENVAKQTIYRDENLYYVSWSSISNMKTRIKGIVTTLTPASFDEILKIVESQIDFNEMIDTKILHANL
jgi:hypothetical protein